MQAIHAPVARYDERIGGLVDRMFAALRPEQPLLRINWQYHPTDELHQPMKSTERHEVRPTPATRFWLRTERQTLRRLPETGAIVFGIKTAVTGFEALSAARKSGLAKAIGTMDAAEIDYRGGLALHRAALDRLLPHAGETET